MAKHKPNWVYTKERASGSLVMWITRTCKDCGQQEETMCTPYDSWLTQAKWVRVARPESCSFAALR